MNVNWLNFISGRKIAKTINDIAEISESPDGIGRFAPGYSLIEDRIFAYIKNFVLDLNQSYSYLNRNLDTYDDAAGNLYITLDSDREEIVSCGSHVDSVPNAGNYDGLAGVATALEVLRVFFEYNVQTKRAFRVIIFRAEEGSAVGHSTLGSAIATGQISLEKLENLTYGEESFKKTITEKGYNWDELKFLTEAPIIDAEKYRCFLELHIEQARILQEENRALGIVSGGIGGSKRFEIKKKLKVIPVENFQFKNKFLIKIKGRKDHSGGTPMNGVRGKNYRKDALVDSASFVMFLQEQKIGEVADWHSENNSFSTICDEVSLLILSNFGEDKIRELLLEKQIDAEVLEADQHIDTVLSGEQINEVKSFILNVQKSAQNYAIQSEGYLSATVTSLQKKDNDLKMLVDIRILDEALAEKLYLEIRALIEKFQLEENLISETKPVFFDNKVVDALAIIYKELFAQEPLFLPSMPGHDARNLAKMGVPTGMIFVRCKDGISHSPDEEVNIEDLVEGGKLLAASLVYFANR